jgi:hypothetical protein
MWEAGGRPPVDGVLALDVEALAAVLRVVGPVEVDGTELDADAAVRELVHDQYVGVSYEDDQRARRDRLGTFARAVVDRLDRRSPDPAELAEALANAARARHVLAWGNSTAQRRAWEAAGVSGQLRPDSLLVSVLNMGGNKLDQFVDVDATLASEREADATDVRLRLRLRNRTPAEEPVYIAGPHPGIGGAAGTYRGIVAFSLPGAASGVEVDGGDRVVALGRDGPTLVIATDVVIAARDELVVTVRFRLPAPFERLRVEPSARLAPIDWRAGDHSWSDGIARSIPV